jgi:hypothetical protein
MDEEKRGSIKDKLKRYIVITSIFLGVILLPWLFVTQLFAPGRSNPVMPIKPADLKNYYIGTVNLINNETKSAVLRIYKVEETQSQIVYYYTINLNAIEGRIDSLGLIITKEKRIFAPDIGFLSYERSSDNRILLKSVDQFKKPYWSFEEAR